jgi:hypothetical protein
VIALVLAAALYLPPNPTVSPIWNDWTGGFWNIGKGNEQADTNAIAHVWGGAACTLAGHEVLRRLEVKKPALKSALICTGLGLARLFLLHAPQKIDPGYGAEMRTGTITWLGGVWGAGVPLLIWQ